MYFMSSLKSKDKGKWLLANYVAKGVNRILTTSINTSQNEIYLHVHDGKLQVRP